jgi:phage terminase Nu1 subunit (DNA packaging protein)
MKKKPGISASILAKHLDLSVNHVHKLAAEGVIPRLPGGGFDPDKCRVTYIRYLRDAGRRSKDSDAKTRAQEARTRTLELRARKEEGELVEMTEVEVVFTDIISTLSAELGGVPASCTRDLALRETITENQNAAINRAKKSFDEKAASLQGGVDMYANDEEAESRRMGS